MLSNDVIDLGPFQEGVWGGGDWPLDDSWTGFLWGSGGGHGQRTGQQHEESRHHVLMEPDLVDTSERIALWAALEDVLIVMVTFDFLVQLYLLP